MEFWFCTFCAKKASLLLPRKPSRESSPENPMNCGFDDPTNWGCPMLRTSGCDREMTVGALGTPWLESMNWGWENLTFLLTNAGSNLWTFVVSPENWGCGADTGAGELIIRGEGRCCWLTSTPALLSEIKLWGKIARLNHLFVFCWLFNSIWCQLFYNHMHFVLTVS